MNDSHGAGPKFEVDVEGTLHPWERDEISASELITLGGWPADQGIVEVNLKTQEERTLQPDEVVKLKPGHGFSRKIAFKRG